MLIAETETDLFSLIGYYPARQADSENIRLWEMAGTAHADATLLGPVASQVDAAIKAGFVLADDRRALLADAQPGRITG